MILLAIAAPAGDSGTRPLAEAIEIAGTVECLRRDALAERVSAWSGHETVPPDARVEIVHDRSQLTMKLVGIGEAEAVRTFAPPPAKCDDVEIAVAVALAVALDGEAIASELDAKPSVTAAPPPLPKASPPPETPSVVEQTRDRGPSVHLAFGAGASIGVLPGPGLELASEVQVRWSRIAIVAGIDLGASPAMRLGTGPGRADATRIGVHAGLCLPVQRGRFGFALCAIANGGPTIASSRGIAVARTDVVPWIATLARLELAVDVSPNWTLVLGNELVTSWIRPSIVALDPGGGPDARLRTPLVGWRGLLGARVRLGSRRKPPSAVKRGPARGMDGVG